MDINGLIAPPSSTQLRRALIMQHDARHLSVAEADARKNVKRQMLKMTIKRIKKGKNTHLVFDPV